MLTCLRTGTSDGCCEHDNEPLGSTKLREFLNLSMKYWLLELDFAPQSLSVSKIMAMCLNSCSYVLLFQKIIDLKN